jgi:RNA polymerase sigma-70 factor (ECF subfamily)
LAPVFPGVPQPDEAMDDTERMQWLATHIVPFERKARAWLHRHVRTLSVADADDILQEAYARIWVLEPEAIAKPRAYFLTIIRNLVAEQARRAKIVPMVRMGEIESLNIISEEPGPERHASAGAELERLRRVLEGLPAQARRAFELRKIEGLTGRQVAERLGITESAVEKLLARALARVLDAMSETEQPADEAEGAVRERALDQR